MPLPQLNDVALRTACQVRLAELDLPHAFTTADLRRRISELRGKPIVLRPLRTTGLIDVPCGIRLEDDEQDVLYIEGSASSHHQRHIITHELFHIFCDHPGSLEMKPGLARVLGIDPALVRRMSGRTAYGTEDEREAEMLASLARQRMYRDSLMPPPRPNSIPDRVDAFFASPARPAIRKGWFRTR